MRCKGLERKVGAAGRKATLRQGLALFLMITLLFVILYYPCIFQGKMYGYHDIGRDTKNQYLPNMVYALRSFRTGEVDVYRLDRGLGEYYPSLLYKYINGVNIPLMLFGEENLAWGLLAATYLKYLVIAVFSWLFFRRILGRGPISVCCAVLWTYCSYSVLWGQHYHLLTSICAFTIEIYGLQLFLESDRKAYLLIPAVACMAYTGYFYLWMGTFFVLGYSLCYLIFRGEEPLEILRKALVCILGFIWACLIAGEYMFPGVQEFIESTRGKSIVNASEANGLFYGLNYIYAFAARLLSTNLLGVGSAYRGPANYYEIAFAGMGIIFILSVSALLMNRRTRGRTIALLILCGVLTCMPLASKVFSMRSTTQRWSFIIQLVETIAIGFGLKLLFEAESMEAFRRNLINALILTDLICCSLTMMLWVGQGQAGIAVNGNVLVRFFVLLAGYNVLLICVTEYFPVWSFSVNDFKRLALWAITVIMCVEIVMTAYPAINDRQMISQYDWENNMYYDGTEQAVGVIREKDDGLYRVGKTYESVSRNDEIVQGFNGVAVYNSLNAHWLVNYFTQMGYNVSNSDTATGANYIRFLCNDAVEASLLGVRYIIRRYSKNVHPLLGFMNIWQDNGLKLRIMKNRYVSSFGYLYNERLDYDEISRYGKEYVKAQMTRGYFDTVDLLSADKDDAALEDGGLAADEDDADGAQDTRQAAEAPAPGTREGEELAESEGLPGVDGSEDEEEGLLIINDPEVGYHMEEVLNAPVYTNAYEQTLDIPRPNIPVKMTVTANAVKDTDITLELASGIKNTQPVAYKIKSSKGRRAYTVGISGIWNPNTLTVKSSNEVWIESVMLEYEDCAVVARNLERLYGNGRVDLSQQGNTFSGAVENPDAQEKMLCVPLIYNQHWHARVDGMEAEIRNINGGLVGLEIAPGGHTVELTYRDELPRLGRIFGAISFALYLLFVVAWHLFGRRKAAAAASRKHRRSKYQKGALTQGDGGEYDQL